MALVYFLLVMSTATALSDCSVSGCKECHARANRRCLACIQGLYLWTNRFVTQCINSLDNCKVYDSSAGKCLSCEKGYLLNEGIYCVEDLNRYLWHYVGSFLATLFATLVVMAWILIKFRGQFVQIKKKRHNDDEKEEGKQQEESGRNIGMNSLLELNTGAAPRPIFHPSDQEQDMLPKAPSMDSKINETSFDNKVFKEMEKVKQTELSKNSFIAQSSIHNKTPSSHQSKENKQTHSRIGNSENPRETRENRGGRPLESPKDNKLELLDHVSLPSS